MKKILITAMISLALFRNVALASILVIIVLGAYINSAPAILSKGDAIFFALKGVDFIVQKMHDPIYGGFYTTIGPNGEIVHPSNTQKDAAAAAITSLAMWETYHHLSDPKYRDMAIEAADQMLKNWNQKYGGFNNYVERDWTNPDTLHLWVDNSMTTIALLRTYEETGNLIYKEKAIAAMDYVIDHLWYAPYGNFDHEVYADGSYTSNSHGVGEWVEAWGILASWKAYDMTGDSRYRDFALSCAQFERDYLYDAGVGSFYHFWRDGTIVDNRHKFSAQSIEALVVTYRHTGDTQWIELAKNLLNYGKMNLYETEYQYMYHHEGDSVFHRMIGYHTFHLFNSYEITNDLDFLELAVSILETYSKHFYSDQYGAFVVEYWDPEGIGQIVAECVYLDHQAFTILAFWKYFDVMMIPSRINIAPNTINLKSEGEWITAYIELPEGHDVNDINVTTVMLNDTVPAELYPTEVGDYDSDTIPDLMLKFNRTAVSEFILSKGIMYGNVTLTLTGQLYNGTSFEGSDTIMVRMPGDVNCDGKVDIRDVALVAIRFGKSNPDPYYDMDEDGVIDIRDIAITAVNFGKVYA